MTSIEHNPRRVIQSERVAGPEWSDGRLFITPVARTFTVGGRIGKHGGPGAGGEVLFSLVRPSALVVADERGTTRMPIPDVTRWLQLAMVLAALLMLYEFWTRNRVRKEQP
jgi:hypothetical protein